MHSAQELRQEKLNILKGRITAYCEIVDCDPYIPDQSVRLMPLEYSYYVDASLSTYSWNREDRGIKTTIYETESLEDFLEYVMLSKTYYKVYNDAIKNRVANFRDHVNAQHIELLSRLSPVWAERQKEKYQTVKVPSFQDI